MQVKVFTLPFRSQLWVFDDAKFNEFSKDKELVSVSDYSFHRDETPNLTLVVKYKQLSSVEVALSNEKVLNKNQGNEEWRKIVNDDLMPLFNTLSQWGE